MQSKKMSMIESTVNYVITFILSWFLHVTLFRAFGYQVDITDGLLITIIALPIVLGKNYIVRRIFNSL